MVERLRIFLLIALQMPARHPARGEIVDELAAGLARAWRAIDVGKRDEEEAS